jgi:hypothetical protein
MRKRSHTCESGSVWNGSENEKCGIRNMWITNLKILIN